MKQVQGHGRLLPRNLIQGNSSTALCALLIFVVVGPTRVAAESEVDASEMFTTTERWVYGLLTGVVLGLIGFLCAGVVVYLKKFTTINYESSLKVLVAFAAGALIGDALIHMIPEAFSVEEVSDPLDPRLLSFFICLGIFVFALLERIFYLFGIAHSHGSDGREHDHDHGD